MKIDSPTLITDIIDQHPCLTERASRRFGRIHLPVAPQCNIQCNYCDRKYDCIDENRPGVTSKVISPREAVSRVEEVTERLPNITVVGIAGPGDPLCNEETFETFRLLRDRFPHLHKCLSTNGLLLPEKVDQLKQLGVDAVTVTLNAVDPSVGASIYRFVYYQGKSLQGIEAAEVLLDSQLTGIEMVVKEGIVVKVNTVMIPTINDEHIIEVARKIQRLGVYTQNIIPLMPLCRFAYLRTPSSTDRKRLQDECAKIIRQVTHCRQCRADAVGLLHKDMSAQLLGQT